MTSWEFQAQVGKIIPRARVLRVRKGPNFSNDHNDVIEERAPVEYWVMIGNLSINFGPEQPALAEGDQVTVTIRKDDHGVA